MSRFASSLLTASAALVVSNTAHAQSQVVGEDVASRAHAEYAPPTHAVGSFDLLPNVTIGANATDNLRATPTNTTSSAFLTVRPEITARSTWARHALSLSGYVDQVAHPKATAENVTTFGGMLSGLYDLSRQSQFQLNLSAARAAESRLDLGSLRGATSPVRFNQYYASVSVSQGFGRVTTSLGGTVERRKYYAASLGNLRIDQSYRNVANLGASIDIKYDLGNGIGLIGSGRYNKSLYDIRPGHGGFVQGRDQDRGSSGYSLQGGFSLELSKLLFGSARFGYLKQNYRDPTLKDPAGFSMDVDLLWNATPLTSVRVRASRKVQDTGAIVVAGSTKSTFGTRTDFGVGVNHELFRSVLLSADGSYGHFSSNGGGAGGNEYSVGVGVRYLMNRNVTLRARLDHSQRTSPDQTLRYKANRGLASITLAF